MMTVYVVASVVGAVLLLLSLFGGHHDSDHDGHVEHGSGDHGAGDLEHGAVAEFLSPLLSLRFWTYFALSFGIVGLVAEQLLKVRGGLGTGLAVGTGLAAGALAVWVYRALSRAQATSSTSLTDLAGREAEVLVPIRPGQIGRIRCVSKGETLDLLAETSGGVSLEIGRRTVIVGANGDRVVVEAMDLVLEDGSSQVVTS